MPRLNKSGWKRGDLKIHSGMLDDIPAGWELAAETIDRAIVGAGGQYDKGQKFGNDSAATSNHTLSTAQIPAHRHPDAVKGYGGGGRAWQTDYNRSSSTLYTGYAGSTHPHNHGTINTRQKSVAVIWIRKL
ncbi:hypothetical protein ACODM8_14415 [Vibrio ostreicida]|uniref:hypothetical protein n=1 Tax=Vibrio ostreicida TaxID=526588 RepID=UPI003B5C1FD1